MKKWLILVAWNEKMALQNNNFFYFGLAHEAATYGAFSPIQFASNAE